MTKGRLTIRVVAGGYLAYVGFGLARDVLADKPENYMIYLLFGVFFMAVGGVWCILALKRYAQHDYVDIWEEPKSDGSVPEADHSEKEEKSGGPKV